jgi:Chromo (CHRromatin Organisation MOdifier) domain
VTDLDELHAELRIQMTKAQAHYQGPADRRRLPAPDFSIGQQVFVNAEHIRTTRPAKKLSEKFLGPFDIIARPGTHSWTLRLPDHLRTIHPVFHVSQLEPSVPNTIPNRTQSPPPPVEVDDDLEYEIAEILDSKIDNRRRCKPLYFFRWSGYEGTDEENSWLPATELDHAQEIVTDFHDRYPDKPGPLPL